MLRVGMRLVERPVTMSCVWTRSLSSLVQKAVSTVQTTSPANAVKPIGTGDDLCDTFRSNAEVLIAKVPPIHVAGSVAACDGGEVSSRHPIEYIRVDTRKDGEAVACKYCGLRYVMKKGHHGGH